MQLLVWTKSPEKKWKRRVKTEHDSDPVDAGKTARLAICERMSTVKMFRQGSHRLAGFHGPCVCMEKGAYGF